MPRRSQQRRQAPGRHRNAAGRPGAETHRRGTGAERKQAPDPDRGRAGLRKADRRGRHAPGDEPGGAQDDRCGLAGAGGGKVDLSADRSPTIWRQCRPLTETVFQRRVGKPGIRVHRPEGDAPLGRDPRRAAPKTRKARSSPCWALRATSRSTKSSKNQLRHAQKMEAVGNADRRHRPRFQQYPDGHHRLRRAARNDRQGR